MKVQIKQIDLNYCATVLFRVLPNVKYNFGYLKFLYHDKSIISYFKGIRKTQEYANLYNIFKYFGFNMSLCDKIRTQQDTLKESFLESLKLNFDATTDKRQHLGMCNIKQEHLDYLVYRLNSEVFPNGIDLSIPFATKEEVLAHVNLKASQGLPNPFLKKRDVIAIIEECIDDYYCNNLKPSEVFLYPSAAFLRLQIKAIKGMTTRIVNAVSAKHQSVESVKYVSCDKRIPDNNAICIGKTQIEVSKIVSSYKNFYTQCWDHSKWDFKRQQILGIISFEIIKQILNCSKSRLKILHLCRNYHLTLPMFHPTLPLVERCKGVVSGSGFTSLENTLSNYSFHCFNFYNYCKVKGLDPYAVKRFDSILGDDSISGTEINIDVNLYQSLAKKDFGFDIKLECPIIEPGTDEGFFLGSYWKNGKPYRKEEHMVASCVFGTGNFPKMTPSQLFFSRFFEVFGNTHDCDKYFKRIRMHQPDRLFFFNELSTPHKSGGKISERLEFQHVPISKFESPSDSRGFWYNNTKNSLVTLSRLWESR